MTCAVPTQDYPDRYEVHTTTRGGLEIVIRPMRPDDRPLIRILFEALSAESIYFRFFAPLKALSEEMLDRLTRIDYGRDVVLVATQGTGSQERILGVFRLMGQPDHTTGELAIIVGDPWQGKGVAARLFEHGILIAQARGMSSIYGAVAGENRTVHAIIRKLGFSIEWDPDAHAYQLRIDLNSLNLKELHDSMSKKHKVNGA